MLSVSTLEFVSCLPLLRGTFRHVLVIQNGSGSNKGFSSSFFFCCCLFPLVYLTLESDHVLCVKGIWPLLSLVFFFSFYFFFPLRSLINPGRVYDLEQTVGIENLGSEAEKLLGEVIRIMHKFSICFSVLGSIFAKNEKSFH